MNDNEWSEFQKKLWADIAHKLSKDKDEHTDQGMVHPLDGEPEVISVSTDMWQYLDFEEMLKNEGEPDYYEVTWSNGDITTPDGEVTGRVDVNDNSEEVTAPKHPSETDNYKTFAYKAHKRCRKCDSDLYHVVSNHLGEPVFHEPHTAYLPHVDKIRKTCHCCAYSWYELPKDYRDNG